MSVELDELDDRLELEEEKPDEVDEEDKLAGELFLWTVEDELESVDEVEGVLLSPKLTSNEILRASVGGWLTTNVRSVVKEVFLVCCEAAAAAEPRSPRIEAFSGFSLMKVNSRNSPVDFRGGEPLNTSSLTPFLALVSACCSSSEVQQLEAAELLLLLLPELDPKLLRLPPPPSCFEGEASLIRVGFPASMVM